MGEIVNDLMVSLRAHLQDKMIDNVPDEYVEMLAYTGSDNREHVLKPSLVKVGRLQDDPTELSGSAAEPSSVITIHTNDPGDLADGWKHSIAGPNDESTTNLGLDLGRPYELTGTELWWRRIKVEFEIYFLESDQTQAEATRLANAMRGLLEQYCRSYNSSHEHGWRCFITDDFGEYAMLSSVAKAHCSEGGGPDDDYIWRGELWLQVLTVKQ